MFPLTRHAVSSIVGGDLRRRRAAGRRCRLIQRGQHSDDFRRRRILQANDFDVLIAGLIHSPDDVQHSVHVARAIRDDENI